MARTEPNNAKFDENVAVQALGYSVGGGVSGEQMYSVYSRSLYLLE